MDNAELTQLMQKVAIGDERAFRTLSNALSQKIFAMAFRFLSGDRASAEDVMQDVLIKLWQYAPRWEAGGSVQGFVSRLTYNASMDVHRGRKNKSDEIPETLSVPETASDTVLNKEYKKILLQAIQSLPERQQEALLLTYFHENSRRDVAATMKTTEKAVEHLVARGLKALEKLIPSNLNGEKHVFASRSL
jgi:RNA polymerase sigma-70 factor (ECF subfamily)